MGMEQDDKALRTLGDGVLIFLKGEQYDFLMELIEGLTAKTQDADVTFLCGYMTAMLTGSIVESDIIESESPHEGKSS